MNLFSSRLFFLLFVFAVLPISSLHAADAPAAPVPAFPLLGKWRVVGRTDDKGVFHKVKNGEVYVFYKTHSMGFIPWGEKEASAEWQWSYDVPGDIFNKGQYWGDSHHAWRVRFHVDGNNATMKTSAVDAKEDPDDKPEGTLKLERIPPGKAG